MLLHEVPLYTCVVALTPTHPDNDLLITYDLYGQAKVYPVTINVRYNNAGSLDITIKGN